MTENKWHEEKCEGFDIRLTWDYEDLSIESHFPDDTPEQIAEINRKLDNHDYIWFIAIVSAYKNGIRLATEYLGGNLYDSMKQDDFIKNGYYQDMKLTVIKEAREVIKQLASEI